MKLRCPFPSPERGCFRLVGFTATAYPLRVQSSDEATSHSTKHDKAVQVAGYASVDVKRVGPAPGEPDQFTGDAARTRLTNEAPARVFHQGPGESPT